MATAVKTISIKAPNKPKQEEATENDGEVVEAFESGQLLEASVSLPHTIYSACILILGATHSHEQQTNQWWSTIAIIIMYLELFASHFAQGYLTYLMYQVQQTEVCNYSVSTTGRVIVLALFSASIFVDFRETWNMVLWTYHIRTSTEAESLQVRVRNKGKKNEKRVIASGITLARKIFFGFVIFLPKFGISMGLLILCGAYLAKSSTNELLILHALAINFILSIDEIVYNLFVPNFLRTILVNLPPIDLHRTPARFSFELWAVPLTDFIMLGGIAAFLYFLGTCYRAQQPSGL